MNYTLHRNHRRGGMTGGIILLGIGLLFLLANLHLIPHIGRSWPLILIIIGVALLVGSIGERNPPRPTAPPGSPGDESSAPPVF